MKQYGENLSHNKPDLSKNNPWSRQEATVKRMNSEGTDRKFGEFRPILT